MTRTIVFAVAVGIFTLMIGQTVRSEDAVDRVALVKALAGSKISLQQGLTASLLQGRPISAKFEMENGKLQLSIYTEKNGKFFEVIVNHRIGSVTKSEPITQGDDLTDAKAQSAAMSKAKSDLRGAVDKVAGANRAVSVTPDLKGGHSVANIVLIKDGKLQSVTQLLD
jgi:hypothetical protein